MRTRLARLRRVTPRAAVLIATAVLASGLVAVARTTPQGAVTLAVELPDNPTVGARLFAEKQCVRCHALGGGESRVGPDLGRIHFSGTVLDLAGAFWNHATVMREKMRELKIPPPTLSSREMADLVAFLTAYRYYLTQVGAPASPTRGRDIFEMKRCAGCHGAPDDWQKRGPSLVPYRNRMSAISLAQAMWNHGAEMAEEMRRADVPWPQFKEREMADLLAYLETGNASDAKRVYFEPGSPRRGGELFHSKRCVACHSIAGTGGRGGPDLGALGREMIGSLPAVAGLMWNHSHGMTREFRRRGLPRVTFSGQEMADVIAYLYFVNYARVSGVPSRGEALFSAKCARCHAMGSERIGPDLSTVAGLDEPIALMAAMWNHSSRVEQDLRQRGLPWPRLAPGEAADLAAFVLTARGRAGAVRGDVKPRR